MRDSEDGPAIKQAPSRPAVTSRALILGAILIPFNVYWVMMVEGIWHTGHPTVMALPWGVVFNIILLLLANVVLKRFFPRHALTQAEFVTVYVMVAIACMLSGHDSLQLGVPNLSHGWWFATEANGWEELFHRYLPKFATVSDPSVLEPYYYGHETLYTRERMLAWLGPTLWWCAVVLAVGKDNSKFVSIACVNIVVAANAGGAFSPFGDITTLMVWQKGVVEFQTFFLLFIPSLVNFLVPAFLMHFFVPQGIPEPDNGRVELRRGAYQIVMLFGCTIATAVTFHSVLHMPPMLGMMTGLAYLQFYGYYLKKTHIPTLQDSPDYGTVDDVLYSDRKARQAFDVFGRLARAEWDTLLFFYGVVLCVGGLGFIGYLSIISEYVYVDLGATSANVLVGFLSAVIDNIPVMFAVLTMQPDMSIGQWLLVTLTAGVGGSMLSIGSAAGVALMGQARGMYTFFTHLKWTPVIMLGYAASILTHLWINADAFLIPVSGG